jgi:hypothetical protein
MPQSLRRALVPVAFLGSVALVILVLDWNLASRVAASVEEARSALVESVDRSQEAESTGYQVTGVPADLCRALTGRVHGGWMLPRTRRVIQDNPFEVRVEGDRCRRGSSNHALSFTIRPTAPGGSE